MDTDLRLRAAAAAVGIRVEAIDTAAALIDDDGDDAALEQAFIALRKEHGYLFAPGPRPGYVSIQGGARNYEKEFEEASPWSADARSRLSTAQRKRGEIDFNELHGPTADASPPATYSPHEV